jgi:hypothetical protein
MLVLLIYLALGVLVWWHAWSGGPSVTMAGGSPDPAQHAWSLAWALHAIERRENPFFTRAIYAPAGVNLLDNTSILAVGVLFAPVTALFGPIVSFDVAVTLAPVASALAAFFAVNRYARWQPAAFVGGLCYGFGPFLATDLRFGHLHLTFLAVPPLICLALDELFIRQRRPPLRVGLVLGVLVIVQFFISTELLALTVIIGFTALAVLALTHRRQALAAARFAAPGLAAGFCLAAAALAYPAWFAISGPRHFTGPVFSIINNLTATLAASVVPHGERPGVGFISGGNGAYLGAPLLLVLVVARVVWRRDATLRFAMVMAAIAYLASLGPTLRVTQASTGIPLPAWVFPHLPLLDSIVPSHFGLFVDFFVGMALAVVLDRIHGGDLGALARPAGVPAVPDSRLLDIPAGPDGRRLAGRRPAGHPLTGRRLGASQAGTRTLPLGLVCGVTAAIALVPMLLLPPWPYPVRHVAEPPIFRQRVLTSLGPGSIVVEYPTAFAADGAPLLWQAVGGITYELSDGYGLIPGVGGRATELPPVDTLSLVFAAAALGTLKVPLSPATNLAIRRTLLQGHAAALVVTPGAKGSALVTSALTSALGHPTQRLDGAVVWILSGRRLGPP